MIRHKGLKLLIVILFTLGGFAAGGLVAWPTHAQQGLELSAFEKQEAFLNYQLQNCASDNQNCRDHTQFLLDLLRAGILPDDDIRHYEIWPPNNMGPPLIVSIENDQLWVQQFANTAEIEEEPALQESPVLTLPRPEVEFNKNSKLHKLLTEAFPTQHSRSLQTQLALGGVEGLFGLSSLPYIQRKGSKWIQKFRHYRKADRNIAALRRDIAKTQVQRDALKRKRWGALNSSEKQSIAQQQQALEAKTKQLNEKLKIQSRERNSILQKRNAARAKPRFGLSVRMSRNLLRAFKISSYISMPWIVLDVSARLYVWHVAERDPGLKPSVTLIGSYIRNDEWGEFLKNYWRRSSLQPAPSQQPTYSQRTTELEGEPVNQVDLEGVAQSQTP